MRELIEKIERQEALKRAKEIESLDILDAKVLLKKTYQMAEIMSDLMPRAAIDNIRKQQKVFDEIMGYNSHKDLMAAINEFEDEIMNFVIVQAAITRRAGGKGPK